jgi:excisionase family DNA binding protein
MENVVFTNLSIPEIRQLFRQELENYFENNKQSSEPQPEPDRWFDLNELCQYIPDKPSKPTVYGWVSAGTIPVHKGGKKLRFLKSEIDNWLKQGRKKTLAETASEAETYLKKKGGNNG